jgi:hypothetical protein
MKIKTPSQVAAVFGCTVDQAREQLLVTAAQLRKLADDEKRAKSRGYTRDELLAKAEQFENALNKE